ncbi:MAG: glycerophosphodiester phosphodiesterase family protein [Pseudomonadota bacterium]
MSIWVRGIAFGLAIAFVVLTVVNASWLADDPQGRPQLIAHKGIAPVADSAKASADGCRATEIEEPYTYHVGNSRAGIQRAGRLGAAVVEVDVSPTADGEMVLFGDATLDCRTNGTGPVRSATLEELRALDIGYKYTADGGATFPLRGEPNGRMPTVEEGARAIPDRTSMLFHFMSDDSAEADLLAQKLKAAGRDPVEKEDGFYGPAAPVARIKDLFPQAWAFDLEGAQQCSSDYVMMAWIGVMPDSCTNGTMLIPVDGQFFYWGFPNRLIERMEAVGGRVIITGPDVPGQPISGLNLPEQLTDIPDTYNGYVWIEDTLNIVPYLYNRLDSRVPIEREGGAAALERRRAQ